MTFKEFPPSETLKPFIKSYYIFESAKETLTRILPITTFAIAFPISGQITYIQENKKTLLTSSVLIGPRRSAQMINYSIGSKTLLIFFHETAISSFLNHPLTQIFEKYIPLNQFYPPIELNLLESQLVEIDCDLERIKLIDEFFKTKIQQVKPDLLILQSIDIIRSNQGVVKIMDLAKELWISQDSFEKRFRKNLGIAPKHFASVVRIQHIIFNNSIENLNLDLLVKFGYYDKPHFNRDFKKFTGLSPKEFFKSEYY